jgi:predicted dehydrogenase
MHYSAENPLRIGIIGAGGIVRQRHVAALQAMPYVKIIAVANTSLASAQRFVNEYCPAARAVADWHDVASAHDVDVVWIGATPWLHKDASIYALDHGKHVFCQARMARDLSEAGLMWEASIRYPDLVTGLCPAPHGMAGGGLVKQLLVQGAIGKPTHLLLHSFSDSWLNADRPAHWRQQVEISGLHVLTLGIYAEVLQRWLGDITHVQADGAVVYQQRGGVEIEVPDFLNVLCRFRNGTHGMLCFSGVAAHGRGDELTLFGTEGTLIYDFSTDEVKLGKVGGMVEVLIVPEQMRQDWRVEQDFIQAVIDPQSPRPKPDFSEGMRYMRVVQAVAMAQDSGEIQQVC